MTARPHLENGDTGRPWLAAIFVFLENKTLHSVPGCSREHRRSSKWLRLLIRGGEKFIVSGGGELKVAEAALVDADDVVVPEGDVGEIGCG